MTPSGVDIMADHIAPCLLQLDLHSPHIKAIQGVLSGNQQLPLLLQLNQSGSIVSCFPAPPADPAVPAAARLDAPCHAPRAGGGAEVRMLSIELSQISGSLAG